MMCTLFFSWMFKILPPSSACLILCCLQHARTRNGNNDFRKHYNCSYHIQQSHIVYTQYYGNTTSACDHRIGSYCTEWASFQLNTPSCPAFLLLYKDYGGFDLD